MEGGGRVVGRGGRGQESARGRPSDGRPTNPVSFSPQERSVFATRCLVDIASDLRSRGVDPAAPAAELALARLASGGALLTASEVELLSSWVALAHMTLDETGAARRPGVSLDARAAGDGSATAAGMRAFVRHTAAAFAGGGGAARLLLAQAMAESAGGGGGVAKVGRGGKGGTARAARRRRGPPFAPPPLQFMQQNSRIIVLTLDAAREAGTALAVSYDLLEAAARDDGGDGGGGGGAASPSSPFEAPVGFAAGVLPPAAGDPAPSEAARARARAVTLLLAFLGARLGSAYAADTFVATAADAYRAGATAAGALAPLTRQELASAGGDAAVPLAGAGPAAVADAGSALLRQWTSIVYMAMAQLGVPHARAGDPNGAGWAFAGPADAAAEAHGLAAVVHGALTRAAEEAGAAPPGGGLQSLAADARATARGDGDGFDSDTDMPEPSRTGLPMLRTEDPELARTSASLALLGEALEVAASTAALVAARADAWGLREARMEEVE